MSVGEAAEYFGVSKEAIHNRIRRGSLESVVEDGIKMVMVGDAKPGPAAKRATPPRRTSQNDERYYRLLEEQNAKLQARVDTLESETRSLRDQKEQMLIEEREKLERIYKEKDEQLKSILNTISSQFMLNASPDEAIEAEYESSLEAAEVEEQLIEPSEVISLDKYLKKQNFSQKRLKKVKKRFKENAKNDDRITIIGKKYYLDIARYDYSDLL